MIKKFSLAVGCLLLIFGLSACAMTKTEQQYQEKAELLKSQILTDEVRAELGEAPAGNAGHAVFISVCDTEERASVFTGTGKTLDEAWKNADAKAFLAVKTGLDPVWVKADVVQSSETMAVNKLYEEIKASTQEFYRVGLAFDENFDTALLEAELNGHKIYEYDEGGIDLKYLNNYLKKQGREQINNLPASYITFSCKGWVCDEDKVYELYSDGLEYGRRKIDLIDKAYVESILDKASTFLVNQVQEDGSFIYGLKPRFDNEIDTYNIMRHTGTIWSLLCRYQMQPSEELEQTIDNVLEYMLSYVIPYNQDTSLLYESKANEFKLGANGLAIITMTEYMNVFGNDKYVDVCEKLGNGILLMLNQETGEYYHVLDGSFQKKEEFRTIYYDGEATFGLCRLYSLTGDEKWLNAAKSAVNHFIRADYTQYRDHWIAYSMNEITKYVDDPEYYAFAMKNVQENLQKMYNRETTGPTHLELLMVSFETYQRMLDKGIQITQELDIGRFLNTIYKRVDLMQNGYFYPEYAMYMENPQRISSTFMVREDGFRVRIDDVQHNIGGYFLYYNNYDKLVESGMMEYRD